MVKNPPASAGGKGDAGLLFGSGRSPRGGNSNPLHYACLGNPMDRSLAGYSLRGHKELDSTGRLENSHSKKGRVPFAEKDNRLYRQTEKSGESRSYSDLDEKERKLFGVRNRC